MPLFECSKCHCVENTAVTGFWCRTMLEKQPPLCSECDPEIGKWHGHFAKTPISEWNDHVEYVIEGGAMVFKGYKR